MGTNDMPQVTDKLYHIMLYRAPCHEQSFMFELTTLVVIGTDCIGSCKSNYHTITTANDSPLSYYDIPPRPNSWDRFLYCGITETTFNWKLDMSRVCLWLAACRLLSPGTPISSTNKTDCYDITEILFESGIKHHNQTIIWTIFKLLMRRLNKYK
jgi:hypothetical protein